MNEIIQINVDFVSVYNRSYRLAAAVFMISNIIEQNEELRTKIKNLSLNLVSMSVKLKDINFLDDRKLITDIEKNSLELMSMLDIACVAGLVSKMNVEILKEEFQSFVLELGKFAQKFENNKNVSIKDIFNESEIPDVDGSLEKINVVKNIAEKSKVNGVKNSNGHRRKDMRKSTVLEFIKGHNNVSIKDILPNITGCSEKTIQRELLSLINEGKIRKTGERRWSRYSII